MTPTISVIITAHNERPHDIQQTIHTIRETGGPSVEIILVDDCSIAPIDSVRPKVIRNSSRLGVGPSRHLGVEAATARFILLTDAHCVFDKDWLEPLLDVLDANPKLLVCGQCVALPEHGSDLSYPVGIYNGARMVIHDPNEPNIRWRVLTAKWAKDKPSQSFYPLSAVMGACYAMRRDFFLRLGGLKMLREFGGDEELLSLKTILAGGEIRMHKFLRIGHKFREKTKVPYRITVETCLYNTMTTALTCCPSDVAKDLIEKIGPGCESMVAKELVRINKAAIEAERIRLLGVFTRPWDEYLKLIASIDTQA